MVNFQFCVVVIPPENTQGWEIAKKPVSRFAEMCKGNFPVFRFSIRGDKQKIMKTPCSLMGFGSSVSFCHYKRTKDTTQDYNRQLLRFEIDKENTPGLI